MRLFVFGCSNVPVLSDVSDAGETDAESDTSFTGDGNVCCNEYKTDPTWGNNFSCNSSSIPWVCGEDDGGVEFSCTDSRCVSGSWCYGITGPGVVKNCPDD